MTTNNVTTVRAIGKGESLTKTAVPQIVALAPEGFDPSKRGAVTALVHLWACGDSPRPAVTTSRKVTDEDGETKTVQSPTHYGTGVDTLTRAVKRAMTDTPEKATPDYLALILTACETGATKGDLDRDAIRVAVAEWAARKSA